MLQSTLEPLRSEFKRLLGLRRKTERRTMRRKGLRNLRLCIQQEWVV
jgi:hypothetical protein